MFRFTIRELVLLTLVVALGVAWWLDHAHLSQENRDLQAVEALRQLPLQFSSGLR